MRRAATDKYMEMMLVADYEMFKFHGNDTEIYLKTLLNIAAVRFLDPTLGHRIVLTLVKLRIMTTPQTNLTGVSEIGTILDNFCSWQEKFNPSADTDLGHADGSALITRMDLRQGTKTSTNGLAYVGSVCQSQACSITEDTGLNAGITLAHEIGHTLGMAHDHENNNCADGKNIMATFGASGVGSLEWSSCSATELDEFMGSHNAGCLDDSHNRNTIPRSRYWSKPGTVYSVDQQCEFAMGEGSRQCTNSVIESSNCSVLVCTGVAGNCFIKHHPKLDGTECADQKWCVHGLCESMGSDAPRPVNGGWSEWDANWSPCTRTCGGGVSIKRRRCDKPLPRYGGTGCVGPSTMSTLCNVGACPVSQTTYKQNQCAAFDDQEIHGRRGHWSPIEHLQGDRSCVMICKLDAGPFSATLGSGYYEDGTGCALEDLVPFARCLDGKCRVFGCDGILDSGHVFDRCGVCKGSGSTCQHVTGRYTDGTAKAWTTFATIPIGSKFVLVTNGNQYCRMNVSVNGHAIIQRRGTQSSGVYRGDGIEVHYRKSPERIQIAGPTTSMIQLQVWRDYDDSYENVAPEIYYEYVPAGVPVNPDTRFEWILKSGQCSRTCGQGKMIKRAVCVRRNTQSEVLSGECDIHQKPNQVVETCINGNCPPRWVHSGGACSVKCGTGVMRYTTTCIRENGDGVEHHLPDSECGGLSRPAESENCYMGGCWETTDWSQCSMTCGRGVKTRTVTCEIGGSPVEEYLCRTAKLNSVESCLQRPCDFDIQGDNCRDNTADCDEYGYSVCGNSDYEEWVRTNCMLHCGVCVKDPTAYSPSDSSVAPTTCTDTENCGQYDDDVCTAYPEWAKTHCAQTCGHCECTDIEDDCAAYGPNVCSEYGQWAETNCRRHCNLCTSATTASPCVDTLTDCDSYGHGVCSDPNYTDWVQASCRRFCGICGN